MGYRQLQGSHWRVADSAYHTDPAAMMQEEGMTMADQTGSQSPELTPSVVAVSGKSFSAISQM